MINSKTERERYEEAVMSGGGGYDSSDNTLYTLGTSDGSYDRRAILHELGHFKQYLNQDVQENFSPKKMTQENQRLNLLEFHNIILHENFYQPRTEFPLENIKCSYKKDTKGDYYRITYLYPCTSDLKCSLNVRQGLTDVENRLATEILGDNGLKNSIYDAEIKGFRGVTTKIRAMLINALLKFCGNYFEKAQT